VYKTRPGYDSRNTCSFNRCLKVSRDGAEVTSAGRSFHMHAPATEKARCPIVGSLTTGTQLVGSWRPQSLSRWDVGDRCELSPVLRDIAMWSPIGRRQVCKERSRFFCNKRSLNKRSKPESECVLTFVAIKKWMNEWMTPQTSLFYWFRKVTIKKKIVVNRKYCYPVRRLASLQLCIEIIPLWYFLG